MTPKTFVQKLDGSTTSLLNESFDSRFGMCSGNSFTPGQIAANGAVCATVGICTTSAFGSYQFEISGTDANGHTVTYTSPTLQFASR